MSLVTIIITTFRRATLLPRALASAAAQTYRPLEILVVNESTPGDSAKSVVDQFIKDYPGVLVRYIEIMGRGISAARNDGVRKAGGEFVVFLDDDDALLPEYVASTMNAFERLDASYGVVGTGAILIDENGKKSYNLPSAEPFWNCIVGSGWTFRRKAFNDGFEFDESLTGHEDWEFSLRFFDRHKVFIIDKALREYTLKLPKFRQQAVSLSSDRAAEYGRLIKVLERHYGTFRRAGPAALAMVELRAGVMAGEARKMKDARAHFRKSLHEQFSLQAFFYALASIFGYYGFILSHLAKSRIMRTIKILQTSRQLSQI
jgi:glycosyltransferase involved in cell wall biosynthesis